MGSGIVYYICIDIGGTSIKYGVLDGMGEIFINGSITTKVTQTENFILLDLKKLIKDILEQYVTYDIKGICVSSAGVVNPEKGEIVYSGPTIPGYTGTKIKEEIEKEFGIRCEVENDVNCAGLAEYKAGAAAGSKAAVMLTIGTGIGGCILLNGEVFHGFSNSACEVGYMHMDDSDFQTLGAASILTKKVAAWKEEPTENWSGYHIFEEAKKDDEICNRAIDEMVDVLGKGIANICYVVNPEVVVLGGGIMAQEAFLKDKIEKAVEKYLVSSMWEHTSIAFAKNQNNAGMLGAFYHFQGRHA